MAVVRYIDQQKNNGFPLPAAVAHQISVRAAELARQYAPRGPRNSRRRIRATSEQGRVGIYVPDDAQHLIYLDQGIAPFIMKDIEGKTIPIRNPDGTISFRKAKNVGGRIVARTSEGRFAPGNGSIRWRHPGTKPLNFIDKALNQALQEWVDSLNAEDILDLLKQYPGALGDLFRKLDVPLTGRLNFR